MRKIPNLIASLASRRQTRGEGIVEYGLILAFICVVSLGAIVGLGGNTRGVVCEGANALRFVLGKTMEDCGLEGGGLREKLFQPSPGIDETGFVDLYLDLGELERQEILLPTSIYDFDGLDDIYVSTDTPDNIAACYQLNNSQVTCASMSGTASAFYFPPEVTAVGYAILPNQDNRIEMAQPVSITLSSTKSGASQTWDIHVYRDAMDNTFEPTLVFEDHTFPVGTNEAEPIMVPLTGEYGKEALKLEVASEGRAVSACYQIRAGAKIICEEPEGGIAATLVNTTASAVGYSIDIPRDVREEISTPVTITLSSTYDYEDRTSWNITVARPAGEAPELPELILGEENVPVDTTGLRYAMMDMPQDEPYPSALEMTVPRSEDGFRICYTETATSDPTCSAPALPEDGSGTSAQSVSTQGVSTQGVEVQQASATGEYGFLTYTIPEGAYSVGFGIQLPEDVLSEYSRTFPYTVTSVDYPDMSMDASADIYRPAFDVIFEPSMAYEAQDFPVGTVNLNTVMVPLSGSFNTGLAMRVDAGQTNVRACYRQAGVMTPTCGGYAEDQDSVSSMAKIIEEYGLDAIAEVGIGVDFGESEFQPVDQVVTFSIESTKVEGFTQSYEVAVTREAAEIIFEPDMAAMVFENETYEEATEGWQEPQLVALAGTFNTDLVMAMPQGVDAGLCYLEAGKEEPTCSGSALEEARTLEVPMDAEMIGFATHLSDDIHIEQDIAIAFTLGSKETDAFAEAFSAQATRPAVPVRFDPNLGFRSKVFSAGTMGEQEIMVPIEGEITTGLRMELPATSFEMRACYVEEAGATVQCSASTLGNPVTFDVMSNSAELGFRITLDENIYAAWAEPVSFRVVSDYDDTLDYAVDITVSREASRVAFAPVNAFGDISFAAGETGSKDILQALDGDITTLPAVTVAQSGHEIAPCYQMSSDGEVTCAGWSTTADRTATYAREEGEEHALAYGAGYRVGLPADIHEAVDWSMNLGLHSAYDADLGRDYTVRITRPAVPVIWEPSDSLHFADVTFPERTSGTRTVMIPMAGTFTTDTDFTISKTGLNLRPCWQSEEAGVKCGGSSETADVLFVVPADAEKIGYQITLPQDLTEEVTASPKVLLESSYRENLYREKSFKLSRIAAPVAFAPTVTFGTHQFEAGTTGWARVMKPLTGDFTSPMQISADSDGPLQLCVQDSEETSVRCTEGAASVTQTIDVAPDAVAIGYAVTLPEDPWPEDRQSVAFSLERIEAPADQESYSANTYRPHLDLTFEANISFADVALAEEMAGWFTFLQPLEGEFSTDLALTARSPGADVRLCVRDTDGGAIDCTETTEASSITVSPDASEIGYAVNVSDKLYVDYARSVPLRLSPERVPTVSENYGPTVTRPGIAVSLPPANLITSKTFETSTAGDQTVMAELGDVGNTPMTFAVIGGNSGALACVQETAEAAVVCSDQLPESANKTFEITRETFAIGYRVTLPTDPFAEYQRTLTLRVISTENAQEKVDYAITLKRPIKTPNMPPADLFAEQYFDPGTIGKQLVMAVLPEDVDTRLVFYKQQYSPELEICVQASASGEPLCYGANSNAMTTIRDTTKSWYAIGYRVDLGTDTSEDIIKTMRFTLESMDVANVTRSYTAKLNRPTDRLVMPDRTFFTDHVFSGYDTGVTSYTQTLGTDVTVDLVMVKEAGQPDFQLCIKSRSGSSVSCTAKSSETEDSIDVPMGTYAVGYAAALPDTKFALYSEPFKFYITNKSGAQSRSYYDIEVSREEMFPVMASGDLFETTITHSIEETGQQFVMAQIDPSVNMDMRFMKASKDDGIQLCIQATEGSAASCSSGTALALNVPYGTYAIGYSYTLPSNEFETASFTPSLTLRSVEFPEEEHGWDITITRDGRELYMPDTSQFQNRSVERGSTGTTYDMVLMPQNANSDLRLAVARQDYNSLCYWENQGAEPICQQGSNDQITFLEVPRTVYAIGYATNIQDDHFLDVSKAVTMTVTPLEIEEKQESINVQVTRQGSEIFALNADDFQDYAFEVGTSSWQYAKVAMPANGNSDIKLGWPAKTGKAGQRVCYWMDEEASPVCRNSAYSGSDLWLTVPKEAAYAGYGVDVSTDLYNDFSYAVSFRIQNVEGGGTTTIASLTATRPAAPVTALTEADFPEAELEAGATGLQFVKVAMPEGANTDIQLGWPQRTSVAKQWVCYWMDETEESRSCQQSSYSSYDNYLTVPKNAAYAGYAFDLGTDAYNPASYSVRFQLRVVEGSVDDVWVSRSGERAGAGVVALSGEDFPEADFEDGATGIQFVKVAMPDGANSALSMGWPKRTSVGKQWVCYWMDDTEGSRSCRQSSYSSYDNYLTVPKDAAYAGYAIDLGTDAYNDVTGKIRFQLLVVEGSIDSEWVDRDVLRLAAPVIGLTAADFPDASFEPGSTGIQFVKVAVPEGNNTAYSMGWPRYQGKAGSWVCYWNSDDLEDRTCYKSSYSSSDRLYTAPATAAYIGYAVDVGGDPYNDFSYDFKFQFKQIEGSAAAEYANISTERLAAPVIGVTPADFEDAEFAPGSTGYQFWKVAVPEGANTAYTAGWPRYQGKAGHSVCYWNSDDEDDRSCFGSTYSSSDRFTSIPKTAKYIGYAVDMGSDFFEEATYSARFQFKQVEGASTAEYVNFTAHKSPGEAVNFAPQSLPNAEFEEGSSGWQDARVAIPEDVNSGFKLGWPSYEGKDGLQACYWASAGASPVCVTSSYSSADNYLSVPETAAFAGYRVMIDGNAFSEFNYDVPLWFFADRGDTSLVRIDRTVSRPAMDAGGYVTEFSDHTYPATVTRYEDIEAFVMEMTDASMAGALSVRTTNLSGGLWHQPCYQMTPSDRPVCNWGWSQGGTKTVEVPAGVYAIGYRVNVERAPLNGELRVEVMVSGSANPMRTWAVQVKK